jgi:hypothetical protein
VRLREQLGDDVEDHDADRRSPEETPVFVDAQRYDASPDS